jgi:hypothetical protein
MDSVMKHEPSQDKPLKDTKELKQEEEKVAYP